MNYIDKSNKKRIFIIDEIRGFCIICMVVYHALYDIQFIFNINLSFFNSIYMNTIRNIFAGTFIFISGISCNLSKNNLKRGLICFCIGMLMTIATYIIIPQQLIIFGILHLLGICMIIYHVLRNILKKLNYKIMIPILISLYILTFNIVRNYIGIKNIFSIDIPYYITKYNLLFPFGIISEDFTSADYFPIIPWIFIFIIGTYIGLYFKSNKINPSFYKNNIPLLSYIGKHTIWIYILHQPILFCIFNIVKFIIS